MALENGDRDYWEGAACSLHWSRDMGKTDLEVGIKTSVSTGRQTHHNISPYVAPAVRFYCKFEVDSKHAKTDNPWADCTF